MLSVGAGGTSSFAELAGGATGLGGGVAAETGLGVSALLVVVIGLGVSALAVVVIGGLGVSALAVALRGLGRSDFVARKACLAAAVAGSVAGLVAALFAGIFSTWPTRIIEYVVMPFSFSIASTVV